MGGELSAPAHVARHPKPQTRKPPAGKYAKNPFSPVRWMLMVLTPPKDDATIDRIVEMGVEDGRAWAKEHGVAGAA